MRVGSSDDLIHPREDEASRLTSLPSKLTRLHFKVLSDSWGPGLGSGSASGAARGGPRIPIWKGPGPTALARKLHLQSKHILFLDCRLTFVDGYASLYPCSFMLS